MHSSSRIFIDGHERSRVDARDRGLQYGDGLFETMAVIDGSVRRFELHWQRLHASCERLSIPCPDRGLLESELSRFAHEQSRAVLKLILTRGPSGRGYRPPTQPQPTRILYLDPLPEHPKEWHEQGVVVRLCRTVLGDNPTLAGLKSLNRLEQVLARREWDDASIPEGLMLDPRGAVVCGTMSNLFTVRGGVLNTPRLDRAGVAGTTRQAVLAAARSAGMQVEETVIKLGDVWQAEEVFLTNALVGLWPVRRFENSAYPIGPVTRRLQDLLEVFPGATSA